MAESTAKVVITAEDKTQAAFNSVKQKLSGMHAELAKFRASIGSNLINTAAIVSSVYALERLGKTVYDDTVKWQSWQYSLEAGGLTAKETAEELDFLKDTSMKLGLNISDVGQAFSRFVLTGRATGMSLSEINKDFTAVSGAMRIFHLTGQQTTRSWLALTEVMSMGNLQSRQFTQQLGRDWAGIGPLLARSFGPAGGSIQKFIELMKEGKISGQQFLDTFPKMMESPAMSGALSGAMDSIQAAMGRLQTSIFGLFNEAQNPEALTGMTQAMNDLAKTVNDPAVKQGFDNLVAGLIKLVDWAAKAASMIGTLGEAIGTDLGKMVTGVDLSGSSISIAQDNIRNLKNEIGDLQDQMNRPANQTGVMQNILQKQIDTKLNELKMLQKSLVDLQSGKAGGFGSPTGTSTSIGAVQKAALPSAPTSASDNGNGEYGSLDFQAFEKYDVGMRQLKETTEQFVPPFTNLTAETAKFNAQMKQIPQLANVSKPAMTDMSQFAVEAAHNMQDAMASFFENSNEGFKGMVHNFAKMTEQLVANLLSKTILMNMFSAMGGTAGGTGFMSQMMAGMSGGAHATGGIAPADKISLVGEEGAELAVPSGDMNIIPHDQTMGLLSGGRSVHNTVNIDARGAGPDETAKLMSMRTGIIDEMKMHTEYRLRRNAWMRN